MPDPDRDNFAVIRGHLQGVQRRRWRLRAAKCGVLIGIFLGLFCLLGTFLVGYWPDQPPAGLRWSVWGAGALAGLFLAWSMFRALFWREGLAQTARFIEGRAPLASNRLINAVQLAHDPDQPSDELVAAALAETARWCDAHDLTQTVSSRPLRHHLIALAIITVATIASLLIFPDWAARGISALLRPTQFITRISHIEVLTIAPGDATVFLGEPVTVNVQLAQPLPMGMDASVLIPNQPPRPMHFAGSTDALTCSLGPAVESLVYAVQIDKDRYPLDKPYYQLTVHSAVQLRDFAAHCDYPDYLNTPSGDIPDFSGDLTLPFGTDVTLELTLDPVMSSVVLEHEGLPPILMTPQPDATYHATLDLAATRYRLLTYDSSGRLAGQFPDPLDAPWFTVVVANDTPPTIAITSPGEQIVAPRGEPISITSRATDDHAITRIALYAAVGEEPFALIETSNFPPASHTEHTFMLPTDTPSPTPEGMVIRYYTETTDNRDLPDLPPQTTRSAEHRIALQAPDAFAADRDDRLEQLRQHLLALLEQQARLRVHTQMCLSHHSTLDAVQAEGDQLRTGQQNLHQRILNILSTFPFETDTDVAQQVLATMAETESLLAIQQADDLSAIDTFDARSIPAGALAQTQDTILRQLEVLLGVTPSAATAAPAGTEEDPKTLAEETESILEELATQQRRIIEATQEFGDTSIDDLTPEEREELGDLEVAQEDLHRFLDDAQTRLDKLQAQDFSVAVALAELASIRADVTMAEEALEQLATEIATAAEASAAENAESLATNLEKWLPDTPDREQWEMEDLPEAADINSPELPDALQDMIGDLLEEEEDLFEAMDDLSSNATTSLDKGAGWDAVDGPISNMNAQGVTGNQLPNTTDVAGRSGEGRSGRSEGEYVEDGADGKGGRRTETRLTDDPFQAGTVDDTDDSPPGGATGGGKVSGAGAQGLEGPPPPEVQAELDALAGQQALLTNRANALRIELQADDLSHFSLTEAVILMNRVQKDLGDYNYQNALAQRDAVLASLHRARGGGDTRIEFVRDSTATTPTDDEPIYAPQSDLPDDYRNHLEEYYRQLSKPTDSR
jgi:hypothetical protein